MLEWLDIKMVVSAGVATVPTVDLAPFMADSGITVGEAPTAAQIEVAAQIDSACRLHGFVHVVNFGLSSDLERAAFAESSSLFALSDDHKRDMLVRISPQTNTGYSPYMHESLNRSRPADLKEAFNVRNPELHPNNFIGCTDTFRTTSLELWTTIAKATRRYAMACALALGVEPDFFTASLKEMDLCTLRFLHYPPLEAPNSKSTDTSREAIRVGEHTDFGFVTFLLLGEGAKGLQIKPVTGLEIGGEFGGEAGGWLDVPPQLRREEGVVGAIVNTGALLARWTNDKWRATAHRVIVPDASVAASHRYSIACFIDPDAGHLVAVDERFVQPGETPKYAPITGLDYLLSKLNEAQGK